MTCPPMSPPWQISLGADCEDTLTLELLNIMAPGCLGPFTIDIMDDGESLGDIVTGEMIGGVFMVITTSETEGQSCMMTITVVDKLPPQFTCPENVVVPCNTPLADIPVITDGIEDCSEVTVNTFDDLNYSGNCNGDFISKYTRTYVVADEYGNTTTCTQMIFMVAPDLDDVTFPPNLTGMDALSCYPEPDTSPVATGFPEVDGFPIVNGQTCNLSYTYTDVIANLCSGGYKIFRTWTVYDWCAGNVNIDSVQVIEVSDQTPPEVDAPDTLYVSAQMNCQADVLIPPAIVTEDCSGGFSVRIQGSFGTIQGNGGLVPGLAQGVHPVIYIATNECNLEGRDTLIVIVVDDVPPIAICNAAVAIPLGNMGMTIVSANAFDGGSTDNCGDVYFKVRRMDVPASDCFTNGNSLYQFDDVIKFCCEDVGNQNLMVVLRAYDVPPVPGIVSNSYLAGHFSECMVQVQIQDKTPPQIVCPSDLTISCIFDFDPDNLSVFGEVVTDPADREQICLDDLGNPNTYGLTCVGLDGLATDNCNVTISESVFFDNNTTCGTGYIYRTFTATDAGGLKATCQQVISIINYTPFTADDIIWPGDYTSDNICDVSALDPEDLPPLHSQPVIVEDECDLVTFTHEDLVFDFSNTQQACFKILRTWTVLDWCQYQVGGSAGLWVRTQVIKVHNTIAPEIELAETTELEVCTDDPACGPGNVLLEATASDDCSGPEALRWTLAVDEDNNGSLDQVYSINGEEVSRVVELPLGFHRILYSVEDLCGNVTTEEQFVTMLSCKPPSAKCRNLTTTLMPMDTDGDGDPDWGMVRLWASDLDAGSDHACGNPVQVAFSSNPADIYRDFDCDDLGDNAVQLWVIDDLGHTDFCIVTITIQDNFDVCPDNPSPRATISGTIETSSSELVPGVSVDLLNSTMPQQLTDVQGAYNFPPMPLGGTYEIKPVLDTEYKKGVSTLDLIILQKHLLGLQILDSPYKAIAADANHSETISAMDIVVLRRLILGISQTLPGNTSWRFVDQAYHFSDPLNPLVEAFPESYSIPSLSENMQVNFIAVKVGDLNGSAMSDFTEGSEITQRTAPVEVPLFTEDRVLHAGQSTVIEIHNNRKYDIDGMQFTLTWDPEAVNILPLAGDAMVSEGNWNDALLSEGLLPISWTQYDAGVAHQDEMLSLQVTAHKDIALSEIGLSLTGTSIPVEGVLVDGRMFVPRIEILPMQATNGTLIVYQNRPNPFERKSIIPVVLPAAEDITLDVHNVEGRLVEHREIRGVRGYNEILVDARSLGQAGVYTCTISTSSDYRTLRMIVVSE